MGSDVEELRVTQLRDEGASAAMELAWDVFLKFEATEYSQQGVETFRAYLQDRKQRKKLKIWGAVSDGELAGMIAVQDSHISLFFVREKYQGSGIGRALFQKAAAGMKRPVTVNSSPYAVEIYRRLGFEAAAPEQLEDGIRYTPMRLS